MIKYIWIQQATALNKGMLNLMNVEYLSLRQVLGCMYLKYSDIYLPQSTLRWYSCCRSYPNWVAWVFLGCGMGQVFAISVTLIAVLNMSAAPKWDLAISIMLIAKWSLWMRRSLTCFSVSFLLCCATLPKANDTSEEIRVIFASELIPGKFYILALGTLQKWLPLRTSLAKLW